jgi:hypothetical protein
MDSTVADDAVAVKRRSERHERHERYEPAAQPQMF